MVDKICNWLVKKMQKSMPDIDEEKAEIINYGLQNLIGELPKFFILIIIAYLLGIGNLTILSFFIILPYRAVSGGFHLHTHLGCIICTTCMYCGNVLLSKHITIEPFTLRIALVGVVWLFGMFMIRLYAPADTENVPILRKKDRKKKQILSYIILTISLSLSLIIKDHIISNMIIFGMLIQTITITRFAYKITKNKYGYELYESGELVL